MSADLRLKNVHLFFRMLFRVRNWLDYCLDLFQISLKKHIIYRMWDGKKYFARAGTTDRGIITTVAIEDEYRIRKLKLKNATIIDIGGQNGYFSTFASKYAKRIYTYEPIPANFQIILKNIGINHLERKVSAFNLAVSDKHQTLKIYLSKNTGGHSMYGSGKFIEVKTTTIPDIFKDNHIDHCDLLKMDIEGAEYDIFYNLPHEYFQKIKIIRMEVHDIDEKRNNPKALVEFLKSKGYKIHYRKPLVFARQTSS